MDTTILQILKKIDKKIVHLESHAAMKDDFKDVTTKDDLKDFAKLDNLNKFATKDDLKSFATKEDFKSLPSKKDLEKFATKEDLVSLKTELIERMDAMEMGIIEIVDRNKPDRIELQKLEKRVNSVEKTLNLP
jgi:hypothetical protein